MSDLFSDFRHGFRRLLKRPGFALVTVAILALGVGANTAIFSVINAFLLRPLPYPNSGRLVQVWNSYNKLGLRESSLSIPDYLDRRRDVEAFQASCLYTYGSYNISLANRPAHVIGVRATSSMFDTLKVAPLLGRSFGPENDKPGNDKVVVLSFGLWNSMFGADRNVIGREVRLNAASYRILGVMPPEFVFPHPRAQLWVPFAFTPEQAGDESRGREFSMMVARLRDGATLQQAQQQVDAITEADKERFPQLRKFWETSGFGGVVIPYREELFGQVKPLLILLQIMVALVLLIACANVASLLLTRLHGRQRELSVRSALGASLRRLARELLAETLLLSLLGGAAGLLVGFGGLRLLMALGETDASRGFWVGIDWRVLLFGLGISVATGVLFGLLPIFNLRKTNPIEALNEGSRGASSGKGASLQRSGLVVAEVALAVVLLAGTALMARSFWKLQEESPGFNPENVVLAQVSLAGDRYSERAAIQSYYDRALREVRAIPGVEAAGVVSSAPFSDESQSASYQIEGYTPAPGEAEPHAFIRIVDPQYFSALQIPVLAGRTFTEADRADTLPVAVVDQTLVNKYFPNQNPIGRRAGRGKMMFRIVGVVRPVKVQTLERPITKETIYLDFRQMPSAAMTFVVKTGLPPAGIVSPLRRALLKVDPDQPLFNVVTQQELLERSLRQRRVSLDLLLIFALFSVLLASLGIYGVIGFSVAQRTREMGTRMALGAASFDITRLVLGQGMRLTVLGVLLGLGGSLALGSFLSSLLFQVDPRDPITLAAVSVFLALVAGLACYLPARRAARIEPMQALKYE